MEKTPKLRWRLIIGWSTVLLIFTLINTVRAHDFEKLDKAIPGNFVSELAPVFDFDGDSCLPSAGISRSGQQNGGLKPTGSITGECRSDNFLDTSNTLHRYACTFQDGSIYCAHFYALYFEKDQAVPGTDPFGHRHDWENVVIWTEKGEITHGSVSAHGKLITKAKADLPFEDGHLKVVYHKDEGFDGGGTHAMRFAKSDEIAENPYGKFVTPSLISWYSLTGDGLDNVTMRDKLNNFDYERAVVPVKDGRFLTELNEFKPPNYPTFQDQNIFLDDVSDPVIAGTELQYIVEVSDNGTENLERDLRVTVLLPAGVTHVENSMGCIEESVNTLTCELDDFPQGGIQQIEITTLVDGDLVYKMGSPATITSNSFIENLAISDPSKNYNADAEETKVLARADLAIVLTPLTQQVTAGGRFQYMLEVTNNGPSFASTAQINNVFSPDVIYLSDDSGCVETSLHMLTCNLGAMAPGETKAVTITTLTPAIRADDNLRLLTYYLATVANSSEPDPDVQNNDASINIEVVSNRNAEGLQALYTFNEQQSLRVYDLAGDDTSLNLNISDSSAVQWTQGGLVINSPTRIASDDPAAKLAEAINTSGELTFEAWLRPASTKPGIPSNIISMAHDANDLNFTLQQLPTSDNYASRYYARIRTGGGSKSLSLPLRLLSEALTHVAYTRDQQNVVRLYINGIEVADRTLEGGFVDWDTSLPLILANGSNGDQPWLGEYQLVAFFNRALSPAEVRQNFFAGPNGDGETPLTNLQALYTFKENGGLTIHDVSTFGTPIDLQISDTSAVQWTSDSLIINSPLSISSVEPAIKISEAINATGELTLEAWIEPASRSPGNTGGIVTLAADEKDLNLNLWQIPTNDNFASRYYARVRTGSGSKSLSLGLGQLTEALTHITFTRDQRNVIRFYINGVEVADRALEGGFVDWDTSLPLILANGSNGDQPWLGEYKLLAFYNRALSPGEVERHFQAGPELNVEVRDLSSTPEVTDVPIQKEKDKQDIYIPLIKK